MDLTKVVIYDLEIMPEVFLGTFLDISTGISRTFEISWRKDQYYQMIDYLENIKRNQYVMVGFNNYYYDYPILHEIWKTYDDIPALAWDKSEQILQSENRFENVIFESKQNILQIDLYKIHHFDNKAKTVSLKRLEFNMRRPNIVEYTHGFSESAKTDAEMDELIAYNLEDVMATFQFWRMSLEHIQFRNSLIPEFGVEVMNYNDTKIGEKLIANKLEAVVDREQLWRQTQREYVDVKDIVFPNVRFQSPVLKDLLEKMKRLRVFIVGESFEWNDHGNYLEGKRKVEVAEKNLADLKREVREKKRKKDDPEITEAKERLESLSSRYHDHQLSVTIGGATFDLGKGGIHSSENWSVFRKEPGWKVKDVDVTSFYPSIAIEYEMRPEHLPEAFTGIYAKLKEDRLKYPKGTPQNLMLKLALNGTYGKTKSKYSMLYDPLYALQTVINGQLLLLMLWDMLLEIDDICLVQANTDGLSYMVREDAEERELEICAKWERMTRMSLEHVEYESMFIRDVNNYVARSVDGKIKLKGAYNYKELYDGDPSGVVWHKNHSAMILPKAAVAFLLDGTSIDAFVRTHDDVYDFFYCTNVNRKSRLLWGNTEIQRNTRYLVSPTGKPLTKVMPPLAKSPTKERHIGINKGQLVSVHNTVRSRNPMSYDIDYEHYVNEANKLVEGFKL